MLCTHYATINTCWLCCPRLPVMHSDHKHTRACTRNAMHRTHTGSQAHLIADDADDNIVCDEGSRRHEVFGLLANLRAGSDGCPEHVTGGQLGSAAPVNDLWGVRSLACILARQKAARWRAGTAALPRHTFARCSTIRHTRTHQRPGDQRGS